MLRAKSDSSSEILPRDDGESNNAESSKISPSREPLSLPSILQPNLNVLKNINNRPGALPNYPVLKSRKRRVSPIARVRKTESDSSSEILPLDDGESNNAESSKISPSREPLSLPAESSKVSPSREPLSLPSSLQPNLNVLENINNRPGALPNYPLLKSTKRRARPIARVRKTESDSSSEILPRDDGESNNAESSKISPSTEPLSFPAESSKISPSREPLSLPAESSKISPSREPLSLPSSLQPNLNVLKNINNRPGALPNYPLLKSRIRRVSPIARVRKTESDSSSEILPRDDEESNNAESSKVSPSREPLSLPAESSKISPSREPLSLPSSLQPNLNVLKNINNRPGALPSYPVLKSIKRRAGPIARVRKTDRKTENSEVKKVTQESVTAKCSQEKNSPVKSPLNTTPNLENDLNLPSSPSKVDKQDRISILDIQIIHSKSYIENADENSSSLIERNDSESSKIICTQEQTPTSPLTSLVSESSTHQNNEIPPSSPSKLCKNRIKASPSLGNQRSHTSSVSEDISKNTTFPRTRNDSQSSSVSRDNPPSTPKKADAEFRKKMKKSEGSKKLAEARKEFARKFENKKPDHKKLTMMDLIFYNPTTNLMKYEEKKSVTSENDVDDPTEPMNDQESQNDKELSEESEEEIIGPRITIGPDGEIILDQKSLVIENKKAKKAIEAIEKSKLIDGDIDRPYGVFKRTKRSKWSKSDTMKFYRALSSVGTDFTIMTELFPNRTRRELKLKFKKEERDNRVLVDQAVMNPCNFDFEDLKTEFKMMEIEENEIEQQQINNKEMNKKKENKKTQKFSKLTEGDAGTNSSESNSTKDKPEPMKRKRNLKPPKLRKPEKPPKKVKFDILSALSDSGEEEDSESESEVPLVLSSTHTTRYGRKTKRREMYEPDLDDSILLQKRKRENPESEVSNAPGSLMVVPSETCDGNPVVKIFMVADDNTENSDSTNANNKQLIPIAMIRTDQREVEEEIIENNYTIPA